jgi:uncharacterized RDD family membrane protein YckC
MPPSSLEINFHDVPPSGRLVDLDRGSAPGDGNLNRARRKMGAFSTMASQPTLTPSWKQEVNRRVAAHKSRRGLATAEWEMPAEVRRGSNSRAAQAAARVAARFANAPSYSQSQSAEARTAVRAAQIATEVALEAHAAARAVLAGLESASREKARREIAALAPVALAPAPLFEQEPMTERLERKGTAKRARQQREVETLSSHSVDWWHAEPPTDPLGARDLDRLESALPELPIQANLIEFPREQPEVRVAQVRHAAAPSRGPSDSRSALSIFEVDPAAVSNDAEDSPSRPVASQWSGIELQAQPQDDLEPDAAPATEAGAIELASFSRRAIAAVVDGALIIGAFLAVALLAAHNMDQLPSLRLLEIGSAAGLFVTGLIYQALFFTLAEGTPGMKYARVSLCTFDDQSPTRAQLHGRLGAMLLSVLPLGLGLAWAIFDDDHLTWHDRLSRTYQRRSDVPITVR